MSGREWKPGDVALVEAGCWANRKVALRLAEGWSNVNGVSLDSDGIVTPIRRLVVIDPEDREQAERLRDLYDIEIIRQNDDPDPRDVTVGARGNALSAALREFANPTPPNCGAAISLAGFSYRCDGNQGHDEPHSNDVAKALWGERA